MCWRATFALLVALFVTWLAERSAQALPRFAAREGVPCITCHVNPSGGGMRNRYGRYVYAPTRLPLLYATSSPPLDVDVGDSLAFGGDARSTYVDQRPPNGDDLSTFFQMQADLYAAASVYRGVTLYYDQGAWGSFEAMGIWQQDLGRPDMSIYVKAGRFMPTYGLRLENHNLYARQDIGFGPRDKDQGAEVGAWLGPFLLQVSVLNGSPGEKQLDDNTGKAVVGRAEVLGRLGRLHLVLGGSFYKNESGAVTNVHGASIDARSKHTKGGVHWGASLGRLAYLGEADLVRDEPFPDNKQDQNVYSYQSYQELDFLLVRGLELTTNYEFREPDLHLRSGTINRVAGGFEVYPVPYVEIKTLYRQSFGSGPAAAPLDGLREIVAMAHVYF